MKEMAKYRNGSHTVYDIKYHFVWITKYRYKILKGNVAFRLRELLVQGCEAYGIKNIKRRNTAGSCAHVAVMSDEYGTERNHAEIEGKIVKAAAGRISGTEEEILGSAYMGKGIFLRNGRGSRSENH